MANRDEDLLALVEAQRPEDAAVQAIVQQGCICPGLYAAVHDHGSQLAVALYHGPGCPLGPVSVVVVGEALGGQVEGVQKAYEDATNGGQR